VPVAEGARVRLVLVRRAQDLADLIRRRASGESVLGGFIGLKGAHALQDGQEALQQFFDAGFRMIALTHRFNNRYSGASEGCPPNYELDSPAPEMGVTELGRRLLVAAANAGMLIDLAHASSATIKDVTTMPELAGHAMLISHTGVRLTCRRRKVTSPVTLPMTISARLPEPAASSGSASGRRRFAGRMQKTLPSRSGWTRS
jgi:membrane dipeptidase